MKKTLLTLILASMLTLTACTSTADNVVETTEALTEAVTETPTEEITEAPTEAPTENTKVNKINDISNTEKKIVCFVNGQRVGGVMYLPEGEGPFPTVVMISGLGMPYMFFNSEAKNIAKNGVAAVTFDCRGYVPDGYSSEGDFYKDMSPESCVKDIFAVTDFISEYSAIDAENIFLWGHSYGGVVTAMAAAEKPDTFKGFIGIDPAYQMPDEFRSLYNEDTETFILDGGEIGETFARGLMEVDIYEKMKSINGNAVILTGTNNTININYPEVFVKALESMPQAEKIVVDGADHIFSEHREELINHTINFIKDNID